MKFIEKNLSLLLLLACIVGLSTSAFQNVPSSVVIILVAAVIFVSCFNIELQDFKSIKPLRLIVFYGFRFVLFPVLLWVSARFIVPSHALEVFLFALMPVGVSSPAFSSIFGGNVAVTLTAVIMTTLLTPFVIPFFVAFFAGKGIQVDINGLFHMLSFTIFIPIVLWLALRRVRRFNDVVKASSKGVSILFILFVVIVTIGKRRLEIFHNPYLLFVDFMISIGVFILFFIIGWVYRAGRSDSEKITYAVCSGFNNNALGVGLALAYFSPAVSLFFVITEFSWSLLPILFKRWLAFYESLSG